jgi:hypothetical protein
MKNSVFWDVTPCGSCDNRRFGRTCRFHHQGIRCQLLPCSKLTDYFHTDDGGKTFLRNVCSLNSHATSHPSRRHFSNSISFVTNHYMNRDISVGIATVATGYGLDDRGIEFRAPARSRIFSSPHSPDGLRGTSSHPLRGYLEISCRE